uniref:Putative secreted protein n=1 Tax=Ixodes ricinus TaxID=34613 RepID=A0A6B0U3M1_IXORI
MPYFDTMSSGLTPLCLDLLIFSQSTLTGFPVSFSKNLEPFCSTASFGRYCPLSLRRKVSLTTMPCTSIRWKGSFSRISPSECRKWLMNRA